MIPWPTIFPIILLAFLLAIAAKGIWDISAGDWLERMNAMRQDYYGGIWSGNGTKGRVEHLSQDIGDLYKADIRLEKRIKALEEYMNATGGTVTG